jgi:hypothetical protein
MTAYPRSPSLSAVEGRLPRGIGVERLRAEPQPPGTEFLDAETKRQKSSFKRANACRDKIRKLNGRKSRQKRPIWRRTGNVRFARARTWDPLIKTKLSLYCRTGLRSARRDTPFYHCRLGTENVVRIVVQTILDQDQAD